MTDNLLENKPDDQPVVDPNKDYYAELVGEGRKFKDNQTLARSKFESDQYIEILEKRLDAMSSDNAKIRDEVNSRAKLEELVSQLEKKITSTEEPEGKEDKQMPAIDLNQLDSLISTKIEANEISKKQRDNFNTIKNKLQERYGKNYSNVVEKQIEELGITVAELNDMAQKQPKVLIKTLGLDQEPEVERFQAPPRSQRSDSFRPKGPEKRTWAYYQNLRKTDPKAWYDRQTAIQMQQDAIELGEAFKDGDYHAYGGQ